MAHKLSKKGREIYSTLHPDLQTLVDWALENVLTDITLVEGYRPPSVQFEYFKKGRQVDRGGKWTIIRDRSKIVTNIDGYDKMGKHNYDPSLAVDVCAYVSGNPSRAWNPVQLAYIAGAIVTKGEELYKLGIISHKVRWGNDWDKDGDFGDNSLVDMPHLELYKP